MFLIYRVCLLAAAAAVSASIPSIPLSLAKQTTKQLSPGVQLTQFLQANPPLLVDVLTVNPAVDRVSVGPDIANGSLTANTGDIRKGRESVAAYVSRTGVVAAVNGDYFPYTGDPLGLGISSGEIYSEPYVADDGTGRAAIGWLPSGRVIIGLPAMQARIVAPDGATLPITGINRLTSTTDSSDVCLITQRFGPTSGARGLGTEITFSQARPFPAQVGKPINALVTKVSSASALPSAVPAGGFVVALPAGSSQAAAAAHFHVGDKAVLSINIQDATPAGIGILGGSWNRVRDAIGGGPILLRGGRVIVDDDAEHFGGAFSAAPHARTVIGQRPDGRILLVTIDAGSALSVGASLSEVASIMQQLGAADAINLDGGGSTTMAVQGGVTVDYPSGAAFERPVADMVAVRERRSGSGRIMLASVAGADYEIVGTPTAAAVGNSYALSVSTPTGSYTGGSERVVWNGPAGSCGFVSQDGMLHVTGAGHGTILARVDGVNVTCEIDVAASIAAPPMPAPALNDGSHDSPAASDNKIDTDQAAASKASRGAPR